MQAQNQIALIFSKRTDRLAEKLDIPLRELGAKIGISNAMLFGYRTGRCEISNKAMQKLIDAEAKAGISDEAIGAVAPGMNQSEQNKSPIKPESEWDLLVSVPTQMRALLSVMGQMSAHIELLTQKMGSIDAKLEGLDEQIESSKTMLEKIDQKVSRDPVPPPPRKPADLFPNAERPVPPPHVKKLA